MLLAYDGLFHGTSYGDITKRGTLFQFSPTGGLVTLHTFGEGDGVGPQATLTLAPDGAMYGSTAFGGIGDENGGTLFRLVPVTAASVLQKRTPSP